MAYDSADHAARTPESAVIFEGPPVLAAFILSLPDRQGETDEKVALYLDSGVAIVWVLNPRFRTVVVHRPGPESELFNALQELTAEPHLPGVRVAVEELFGA